MAAKGWRKKRRKRGRAAPISAKDKRRNRKRRRLKRVGSLGVRQIRVRWLAGEKEVVGWSGVESLADAMAFCLRPSPLPTAVVVAFF